MVTLAVSYFLATYLLIPASLFRAFISLFIPLKTFQRTNAQELTFAVGASVLPFAATMVLLWTGFAQHPFHVGGTFADRRADYKVVYVAIADEKYFSDSALERRFWSALTRVCRRQLRFFTWYYGFVLVEAGFFAGLVHKWGSWRYNEERKYRTKANQHASRVYTIFAKRLLLPHLSEWTMLLTQFNFPKAPKRQVWADILSDDAVLYRGTVAQFFIDQGGLLTGVVLEIPKRFDRVAYKKAEEVRVFSTKPTDYWRVIPSGAFYIPKEKIVNFNITYVEEHPSDTTREATRELREDGLDFEIIPPLGQLPHPLYRDPSD